MPGSRYAHTRRRRRAPGRVVKVSSLLHRADNRMVASLEAYDWGLEAARLLRHFWPDWFAEHVTNKRLDLQGLMQVSSAFLCLVEQKLFHLHSCGLDSFWIYEKEPIGELVRHYDWSEDDLLICLGEQLSEFLINPMPMLYGLGRDSLSFDRDELIFIIWWLCADTRWQTYDANEMREYMLAGLAEILTALPRLYARTPMEQLCRELDALPAAERFDVELGTLIAFACRQTGNLYADFSHDEMDNFESLNWRDPDVDWDGIREDQDLAVGWMEQYQTLSRCIYAEPELIQSLAQMIITTAERLDPRKLVNIIPDDDTRDLAYVRTMTNTQILRGLDNDDGTYTEDAQNDGAGEAGGETAGDRPTLEFAQAPAYAAVAA